MRQRKKVSVLPLSGFWKIKAFCELYNSALLISDKGQNLFSLLSGTRMEPQKMEPYPLELYNGLEDDTTSKHLAYPDHIFQSDTWLQYFHRFTSVRYFEREVPSWLTSQKEWLQNTPGGKRTRIHHSIRLIVQYGTLSVFEKGRYFLEDGTLVSVDLEKIKEEVRKTKLYETPPELQLATTYKTIFEVVEGMLEQIF
jgi:hypothetical protein